MTENKNSPEKNEQGQVVQFLTFTVDQQEFGVDIMSVREIKGWTEVTRLPNSPEYMRGVMNLRGIIVPIFDLRCRFSMGNTQATPKNVVIIIAIGERTIGVLVDAVSDILEVNASEVKAAPTNNGNIDDKYVNGIISVDKRMVVLLDISKLFDEEELKDVMKNAAA